MTNTLQTVRALTGLALLTACLFLTFQGFPLALLSMLVSAVMLIGYQVAVAIIFHPDHKNSPDTVAARFVMVCVAFAVASFGGAIVDWGGLAVINIGSLPIDLRMAAALVGSLGGVFNIDAELIR